MRARNAQKGFLLITAVIIIAVAAFMAVAIMTFTAGSGQAGGMHVSSTQALYIAESGLARALRGLKTDTLCATASPGAVVHSNVPLGAGNYTVTNTLYDPATPTTLAAGIAATDTTIALTSSAGYAPFGRVQIDLEKIDYTGISGNNLIGVTRGVAGTTAVLHALGASVFQNQCVVTSVGTAGSAQRTVEAAVALPRFTSFLDGNAVVVTTAATSLGTLNTGLPAGTNLVLAKVSFRNTGANGDPQFNAGTLQLRRGGATLVANQFVIDVGGGAVPNATSFPQETQYLLYRDVNAPANAAYEVRAQARTNNNASAEVKMVVINQAPNSSFQDGGVVGVGTAATTLLTHNSGLPAGDNIVLAVAQFDNTNNGGTRTINAGDYEILRGATVLAANQFNFSLARRNRANQGTAMLLMARDVGAPANATYTVRAEASNNGVDGEVKIIVLNGVLSDYLNGGSINVGAAFTTVGSLAATFPAGENLVLASSQYQNIAGGQRSIQAGNERITVNGVLGSQSAFETSLCTVGTVECNDFDKGMFARQANALANPTFALETLASGGAGVQGETKIMAVHFDYEVVGWREVFP